MIDDLALGLALADLADSVTSSYYTGQPIAFEAKGDGSPVTEVDPEVEKALLALVQTERPGDSFLGEEVGWNPGADQRRRWIVDGIDSTVGFAAGRDDWGTLIALEVDGVLDVGILTCPARKQRYWAQRGDGAYRADGNVLDPGAATRLQVTSTTSLADATACLHPDLPQVRDEVHGVAERFSGACSVLEHPWHWGIKVAEGLVDVAFYLGGDIWDHAAVVPIVEEAGGRFTDLWGGDRLDTRTAIYTNGALHDEILDVVAELRPEARPANR